jgi:Lrp/AsnC family transcriptional regulator, leucine-responsive regulatory protein
MLDLKDRKILYELDLDARQSFTQIGKKVGLKKDVVTYRVQNMRNAGIIRSFQAEINTFKLGYNVFRIYITLQYVSTEKKHEIIKHFCDYSNSWNVKSARGEVDLVVIIWVKDVYEFYRFWDNTLDLYEDYFSRAIVSIYIQAHSYKKSYLLGTDQDSTNRKLYTSTCGGTPEQIDEIDYRLLDELAVNGRAPIIDLAEKLSCSSQSVTYRLQNLVKKGVIQGFRTNIDLQALDLQYFKIDIHLKEHNSRKSIVSYLETKPYLECINVSVGWSDIEPEIIVQDVNKLGTILEDVNTKFPNAIKKHSIWITEKNYIERWLPKLFD